MESYLKKIVKTHILPEPQNRFFNWGRLKKLSKCIGLIGPRGSCKSLAAAAIGVLDGLVPGHIVVSNMAIRWGLKLGDMVVGYSSQELDKAEMLNYNLDKNIWVVVDEVNIEFSEARRSSTNRNLIFNKLLQQLRKRQINMIYTTQHEMWVDNRLRFQTDIFIKTKDICLRPGGMYLPYDFGEFAEWRVYDMTGIMGRGSYLEHGQRYADGLRFNGKQWWNTYDTLEIQGEDEATYGKAEFGNLETEKTKEAQEWGWIYEKIQNICENPDRYLNNRLEMRELDTYLYLDINISQQDKTKAKLKELGIKPRYVGGQLYFMFSYWVEKYRRASELALV